MAATRPQKVLVAGDGVAGLETVLALQSLAQGRLAIEMLAPERHFTYRPLAAGAPFRRCTPARVELAGIARDRGFRLTRDAVDRVDPRAHEVITQGGARIAYDVLVVALGARPTVAVEGAVSFRGALDLAAVADAVLAIGSPARVAYVARSATVWTLPLYELALHTAAWVEQRDADVEVLLVTDESAPLEAFGAGASDQVDRLLHRAGVRLIRDTRVDRIKDGHLVSDSADGIAVDLAVALTRPVGPALLGLPYDLDGFVAVDPTGRVSGVQDVYAVGAVTDRPLRHDGLAAQQADVAAVAIAAGVGALVPARSYAPVLRATLVSGDEILRLRTPAVDDEQGLFDATGVPQPEPPHEFAGIHLAPYLGTHGDLQTAG
jgi:sulfide:quinone oxidoreductase